MQKVLVMLDLTDTQNVCADALSGGQKRKLSLGIAILGNPQVGTGRVCAHTCIVLGHSFAFWLGTETVVIFPCHSRLLIHLLEGLGNLVQSDWGIWFNQSHIFN